MAPTFLLTLVVFAVVTTIVALALALAGPAPIPPPVAPEALDDRRPGVRLLSQLLFTRRQPDGITIDCLLVAVQDAGPGVGAPAGLPFTLQFHTPDTAWFADRVEHLLTEWAEDSRELTVELREDHGKVRTVIASGPSSVHLELSGAAGLSLGR